jgi:peptide/nickel transport system permease protein
MLLCAAVASPVHLDNLALQPPSLLHPFGTDDLGRDMLVEIARGMGPSLLVGVLATTTALAIGVLAGLAAAGGNALVDDAIMRALELTSTVPPLLLAIVLGALFGSNVVLTALVLGFSFWPSIARVTRAAGFSLRGQPYVLAAIALGRSSAGIALRHLLPGVLPLALSMSGVIFGGAVLAEATLSFVGLGDPSMTSWGQTIAHAGSFMHVAWWLWLFPGLALVLTCVGVGLLTDIS